MVMSLPAFADHGSLATSTRDGWINSRLDALVEAGVVPKPAKPTSSLTNLEVAQLTAVASNYVMAQAGSTNNTADEKSVESLKTLVEEFKGELSNMDVDVAKLEDRIFDQGRRDEKFESLQREYLKQSGTEAGGYSRAYFDTYRGFGKSAVYSPLDYNDVMFGDMNLRSVPVPFVLFNATLRMIRTIGLYYADPIQPSFDLRWISLSDANEVANLTGGDFYRNYTPLTLWNSEIPVYTMIEPTSYHRTRKDIEELVYMDHGPQWHMRGFEVSSDQDLAKNPVLSSAHAQAMAGEMKSATQYSFANDYAGSEAALDFFDNNLEIKGTGLLLWDDTGTTNVPYIPNLTLTYGKRYDIGSLSAKATAPIDKDFNLTASTEYAVSRYQDDIQNPGSVIQDWALLTNGSVNYQGAHLTLKYLNNGAYFYSPGAQTNRFTPAVGTVGYLSTNQNLDDGLPGYLNNYVFQGVNQPAFAPYDRLGENILPYGDATPNREGFVVGFTADIGKDGWLKPQVSVDLNMHEIQPDYVLTTAGNSFVPVDGIVNTTVARTFGGVEGALTVDLAKLVEGSLATWSVSGDFKHQTTDLGLGVAPFTVNTVIVSLDAGPFPGVPLFEGLILTGAFEQAQSTGSEYTLNGGTPSSLANYATYLDSGSIGTYAYQPLNITRTSWAVGFKLPISKTFEVHGDWFMNLYQWADIPGYDRTDEIWRLTYEVSF